MEDSETSLLISLSTNTTWLLFILLELCLMIFWLYIYTIVICFIWKQIYVLWIRKLILYLISSFFFFLIFVFKLQPYCICFHIKTLTKKPLISHYWKLFNKKKDKSINLLSIDYFFTARYYCVAFWFSSKTLFHQWLCCFDRFSTFLARSWEETIGDSSCHFLLVYFI